MNIQVVRLPDLRLGPLPSPPFQTVRAHALRRSSSLPCCCVSARLNTMCLSRRLSGFQWWWRRHDAAACTGICSICCFTPNLGLVKFFPPVFSLSKARSKTNFLFMKRDHFACDSGSPNCAPRGTSFPWGTLWQTLWQTLWHVCRFSDMMAPSMGSYSTGQVTLCTYMHISTHTHTCTHAYFFTVHTCYSYSFCVFFLLLYSICAFWFCCAVIELNTHPLVIDCRCCSARRIQKWFMVTLCLVSSSYTHSDKPRTYDDVGRPFVGSSVRQFQRSPCRVMILINDM